MINKSGKVVRRKFSKHNNSRNKNLLCPICCLFNLSLHCEEKTMCSFNELCTFSYTLKIIYKLEKSPVKQTNPSVISPVLLCEIPKGKLWRQAGVNTEHREQSLCFCCVCLFFFFFLYWGVKSHSQYLGETKTVNQIIWYRVNIFNWLFVK